MARGLADAWICVFHSLDVSTIDRVVVTPLTQEKLKRRGYHPALEIAKPIARHYHLALDLLDDQVWKPYPKQHVVIFSDVMNSVIHSNHLAKRLKLMGAKKITNWVVLREAH